ncbi:MAG: hypothetical protein ACO1N3_00005 [Gammaproteobacteria bacterium]
MVDVFVILRAYLMPYYIGFDFPILVDDEASILKNLIAQAVQHIECNLEKNSTVWLFKDSNEPFIEMFSHIKAIKRHYEQADRNSAYIIFRVNILRNTVLLATNSQVIPIEKIFSVQAVEYICFNGSIYYPETFFFSSIDQEKLMDPIQNKIDLVTAPQKIEELHRSITNLCSVPRYENTNLSVKIERLILALEKVEDIMTRKKILLAVETLIKKVNHNRFQSKDHIRASSEYKELQYFSNGPRDREKRLLVKGSASCELMLLGFLISAFGLLALVLYNYTVKIYAPITAVGAGLFAYARRSTGAARAIKDVIEEIAQNPSSPENCRASAYRTYPMLSV